MKRCNSLNIEHSFFINCFWMSRNMAAIRACCVRRLIVLVSLFFWLEHRVLVNLFSDAIVSSIGHSCLPFFPLARAWHYFHWFHWFRSTACLCLFACVFLPWCWYHCFFGRSMLSAHLSCIGMVWRAKWFLVCVLFLFLFWCLRCMPVIRLMVLCSSLPKRGACEWTHAQTTYSL